MNTRPEIVFTFPRWEVSGVTAVNLDLVAALRDLGDRCRIVVEEDNRNMSPFDLPHDTPCSGLQKRFDWWRLSPSRTLASRLRLMTEQARLRRIFERCAGPVVLIPGYAQALAVPARPWGDNVGLLGVVQSDDEANIGYAVEHGRNWLRCVCVSDRLAVRLREVAPWLAPVVIPNAVPCSAKAPPLRKPMMSGRAMRIVYAGRLERTQKRILDLPELVEQTRNLPVRWEIAGEGPEEETLRERLSSHIESGTVRMHGALKRSAVRELFRQADAAVMFSEYEGMPLSLLEAMAEGCVPVVSEGCDAGADLVRTSKAGMVVPTGDIKSFAVALETLSAAPEQLADLGRRGWGAIASGPFNAAAMGAAYHALIQEWVEPLKQSSL